MCLGDVYGGTFELLGENLPRLGVDTTFLTAGEADQIPDALNDRTRIMFFETPSNPNLDMPAAARSAIANTSAHADRNRDSGRHRVPLQMPPN